MDMPIRNRLKYWRHKLMIDRKKDFAAFLGVTPEQISEWESQRKQPSLDTAWRLKEKLGCTLDDLFEWIDEAPR